MNVGNAKKLASNLAAQETWNRKAVGSQRAVGDPGTSDYFRQIRAYRYGYETPFIPSVFGFHDLREKRVLEIGIGNGIDAVEMMRNGARYTGLDITHKHLDLTRRYVELEHLATQLDELFSTDLLDVRLPGNYDVIYSFGVLHHIAHEQEYLERLSCLLAPGGQLRIAVYSKYSFFNLYLLASWLFKNRLRNDFDDWRSYVSEGSELGRPVTIKIRSRRQVQALLERAGFVVVRYVKRGFVQNYLPFMGAYFDPNGRILSLLGSLLGWYHCFICTPSSRAYGSTHAAGIREAVRNGAEERHG